MAVCGEVVNYSISGYLPTVMTGKADYTAFWSNPQLNANINLYSGRHEKVRELNTNGYSEKEDGRKDNKRINISTF